MERLDYFLVSGAMTSNVLFTDIDPKFASDHAIPHFSYNVASKDNGPGYWKLNTSLLEYEEYVRETEQIIETQLIENLETKLKWEMMKMKIRGFSFQTGVRKKKAERNKLEALMAKKYQLTAAIEREFNENENDKLFFDNETQLNLVTKEIEEILQKKAQYATDMNAANWLQYGEKNSAYFFGLERSKIKTPIKRIKIHEEIVEDSDRILEEIRKYYEHLFTTQGNNTDSNFEYLVNTNVPKISEEEKCMLDEPLQLQEIEIAVKQLVAGKCPGLDGIQIEWYQKVFTKDQVLTTFTISQMDTGQRNE